MSASSGLAAVDLAQTTGSVEVPNGRIGIWWFLASEVMIFGGLIGCFVLLRYAHGGWAQEGAHVNWHLGALNTLVLVTSSLTMILALSGARSGEKGRTRLFLLLTVLLGLVFLGIKSLEYSHELRAGFTPASGMFWSFYYGMTGLHALHVTVGIIVNTVLLISAVGGGLWAGRQRRVEYGGLYWHFVDIVWIFLFPLIYLT